MELLKRYPVVSLLLANGLALSLLVLPLNAAGSYMDEETFCPPEAEGCDCWDGCPPDGGPCLTPEGCYEVLVDGRRCELNTECTEGGS